MNGESAVIKIRHRIVIGWLATAMAAPAAFGVETLSTAELKVHCDFYATAPDGPDGVFCVRYIQGFIDGAVATDARVVRNVADEYEREEGLTERGIRTRLGNRLSRYGPSYYAEFCLGEPVPLAAVVKVVVERLTDTALVASQVQARELVYGALRSEYPCVAKAG